MKKRVYIIAAVAMGIVIGAVAPAPFQLIGIFFAGMGIYAAVEAKKAGDAGREVLRYERIAEDPLRYTAIAPAARVREISKRRRVGIRRFRTTFATRRREWIALLTRHYRSLPDRTIGLAHSVFFHASNG